ncbi:MAG: hypothetical protein KBE67_01575 [Vitreoscilla sp.]|nr:hypothetical protein [Vitreoscilla sp.]
MMQKIKFIALNTPWLISVLVLVACQPEATHLQAASDVKTIASAPSANNASVDAHQTQTIQVVLEWENLKPETMTAPDNGSLEQILVQESQQVLAGQMLAQFKPDATAAVKRISSSSVNQAAKAQAYQKWQQDKKLQAQGFISEAAVAKSEAAYQLAAQAQTTVTHAAVAAQPSRPVWLQAPFNGVIKPFTVSAGSKLKNGQQLFTIEPLDSKRLKIIVAQENNHELAIAQRIHLHKQGFDLWLQISELPLNNTKQYTVAYAMWPSDVAKIDLGTVNAEIVLNKNTTPN